MFFRVIQPGVELRIVEDRHTLEIYSVMDAHRRALREWLPWVDGTTGPDGTRAWIQGGLDQFARNEGFQAGIWSGGSFVGTVGFLPVQWPNRLAEIGYWLAPNAQGRGIMTAAARVMTEHALVEMGLNRLQIRCAAGNVRSQAIPRRLGFAEEGVTRQGQLLHGAYHDLITFSMLRYEWAGLKSRLD